MNNIEKLNIGCGTDIKDGWINLDGKNLPGVDIVHDLEVFPWPFVDNQFDEIYMKDVLEHLPNTIQTLEEIYRITKLHGKIFIAVPYWNSWEAITDPTHIKHFNEYSFDFFDPSCILCKNRDYYSFARFKILKMGYVIRPFAPNFELFRVYTIYSPIWQKMLAFFASYLSNIIIGLDFYLERI
nr:methyltransferase domain-containing protein [uncultured Methanospirillum sp.]